MMNLSYTTRMAIRVTFVVSVIVFVNYLLDIKHPLWSLIPGMYVASATIGETLQKGIKRVGMTILGCSFGGIVYYFTSDILWLNMLFLFISLYFLVYFMKLSYHWSMFSVGVMIVFFMGLVSSWNSHLLMLRINQTILGCVLAIGISFIIFPDFAKKKLLDDISVLIDQIDIFFFSMIKAMADKDILTLEILSEQRGDFGKKSKEIVQSYKTSKYEFLFVRRPAIASKSFFSYLSLLLYYLWNIHDTGVDLCHLSENKGVPKLFQRIEEEIDKRFNILRQVISDPQKVLADDLLIVWDPDAGCLKDLYEEVARNEISSEYLAKIIEIMNFSRKFDELLISLINVLRYRK